MVLKQLAALTTLLFLLAFPVLGQNPHIALGNKLFAEARYERAIDEYRRVPENMGTAYAQAIYNTGVCYYELWQTSEAIEHYKRAIELKHGNYPAASYSLGVALEDQSKYNEAKAAYIQAIRGNAHFDAISNYRLGLLAARDGDTTTAADYFGKAATHTGEHLAATHNNLGVMLARLGRLTEAESEFRTASQLSRGTLVEADANLKLCRLLKSTAQNRSDVSELQLSGASRSKRED